MKRTISINKMTKKDRDAIIKVDSRIVSVTLEVEMASKAPAWFIEFEKKNDARWEKQEKFNELLLSLPTIKKEIKELSK